MKENSKPKEKNKVKIDIELISGLEAVTYEFVEELRKALHSLPLAITETIGVSPDHSGFPPREVTYTAGIGHRLESETIMLVAACAGSFAAVANLIYSVYKSWREKKGNYPLVIIQIKPQIKMNSFVSIEGKDAQEIEELLKQQATSELIDLIFAQVGEISMGTEESIKRLNKILRMVQEKSKKRGSSRREIEGQTWGV